MGDAGTASTGHEILAAFRQRELIIGSMLKTEQLGDDIEEVLHAVVAHGSRQEAIAATRRLCGLRIVRRSDIHPDLARNARQAWADEYIWIRAET